MLQNLRSFALTVEGDDSVALTTRAVPASEAASEAGTDPPAPDAADPSAVDEVWRCFVQGTRVGSWCRMHGLQFLECHHIPVFAMMACCVDRPM